MKNYFSKIFIVFKVIVKLFNISNIDKITFNMICEQIYLLAPSSLSLTLITAFFISLVFSLQIVKEFLYLSATNVVGSMLTLSFLRELSPVLTSIILTAKVGSYFTAELSTMVVTNQIDVLYVLGINPINYLILPRIYSFVIMLPILNFFSFITSLLSSSFICFFLYNIDTNLFFSSVYQTFSIIDLSKSCFKIVIFGFFISTICCVWGFTIQGGAKEVGLCTTSAIVNSLLFVFVLDFILSYFMFDMSEVIFMSL
uniref:ABC transporter permease n=1 Tax=Halydictyon mirabile TaxID=189652 RepID=A0A4D6WUI1_9FLOR|nr:hypothetical protein [Halydictyon mirabile]